jgi:hypothetical protein
MPVPLVAPVFVPPTEPDAPVLPVPTEPAAPVLPLFIEPDVVGDADGLPETPATCIAC